MDRPSAVAGDKGGQRVTRAGCSRPMRRGVCTSVQPNSSAPMYPDRHDVLCVLRKAVHDENRVEPSPGLLRTRPGVLDWTPGLRRVPLRALREAGADVHLPVVRRIERVMSASHRHRRRWSIAWEPGAFPDVPRLIAPISSLVNSTRPALKPEGASHGHEPHCLGRPSAEIDVPIRVESNPHRQRSSSTPS